MNHSIDHQIIMNNIENASIDVTSLRLFFFSNSCKCLLFVVSMSFFTLRNHSLNYFWSWSFFSERFCWKDDSEDFSCSKCHRKEYRFRRDRFRLFINYFIRWNCDFESQHKKKLRMIKISLRKKARMTSSDNALMLFRRRYRLTLLNQRIKKISISLLISLLCSLNREQRRSFELDANFAFDV